MLILSGENEVHLHDKKSFSDDQWLCTRFDTEALGYPEMPCSLSGAPRFVRPFE